MNSQRRARPRSRRLILFSLDDESLLPSGADIDDHTRRWLCIDSSLVCGITRYNNGPAGLPPSSATASFILPVGWTALTGDLESRRAARFSVCPAGLRDVNGRPFVEVLFGYLDPTFPYTQEGQAGGYLDAIHHHSDDKVQMTSAGVVEHPQYGPINLYRYSSDYWGERLYGQITAAPLGLSVELHCKTARALAETRPALEALLRNAALHGIQASHKDDPRRLQRGW